MQSVDVNYLAVVLATVIMMALGFLWYGPLFEQQWLAAIGRADDQIEQPRHGSGCLAVAGRRVVTQPPFGN